MYDARNISCVMSPLAFPTSLLSPGWFGFRICDVYGDLQEFILFVVTSCLSCLSSLSRLVSFRMRSSITIREKANTLLTVNTKIVRLIFGGAGGYFGTNQVSNTNPQNCTTKSPMFVKNLSHIKSKVESLSSAIYYRNVFENTSF